MNMTENSGHRELGPAKPLFQSSWLALFLVLRQELEARRDDDPLADDGSHPGTSTLARQRAPAGGQPPCPGLSPTHRGEVLREPAARHEAATTATTPRAN